MFHYAENVIRYSGEFAERDTASAVLLRRFRFDATRCACNSPGFTKRIDSSVRRKRKRLGRLTARLTVLRTRARTAFTRLHSPRSTRNRTGFDIFSNCAISAKHEKHGNALAIPAYCIKSLYCCREALHQFIAALIAFRQHCLWCTVTVYQPRLQL